MQEILQQLLNKTFAYYQQIPHETACGIKRNLLQHFEKVIFCIGTGGPTDTQLHLFKSPVHRVECDELSIVNTRKKRTFQTGHRAEPSIFCFCYDLLFTFRVENHHGTAIRLRFMPPENTDVRLIRQLRPRISET